MNKYSKIPVPKYNFKAFGAAIKTARTGRRESRKKVSDEMFISPRYLANIENKGQHPSLQIFFELMLRYNISVDQFLLETPPEKNTQRRQLSPSRAAARRLKIACWEVSQTLGTERKRGALKHEKNDMLCFPIFFSIQIQRS